MTLDELFKNRQSCRSYDPEKLVSSKDLEKIVEAGSLSPSARNLQPWFFTVVNNHDTVLKIREARQTPGFNDFTSDVNAFIVIQENKDLSREYARDFTQIDLGLTTAHMILKATDLGLSTCILGSFDEAVVRNACNITSNQPIRLVLAIGYAKADDVIRDKKRKELNDIAKFL